MELLPSRPSILGSADLFTGTVYLDMLYDADALSRTRASFTRFMPSARTAWHCHALGQVLHILDGVGLVQARGGDVLEVHAGDTVYSPPDEWHWHGAAPDRCMTHLALWAAPMDQTVAETTWGEHVDDDHYGVPHVSTRERP